MASHFPCVGIIKLNMNTVFTCALLNLMTNLNPKLFSVYFVLSDHLCMYADTNHMITLVLLPIIKKSLLW